MLTEADGDSTDPLRVAVPFAAIQCRHDQKIDKCERDYRIAGLAIAGCLSCAKVTTMTNIRYLQSLLVVSTALAGCTGIIFPLDSTHNTGGSSVTVTTGGALATGGASSMAGTSNGGASVGGSTASVHSRAVVVDPASNRFAAYDAEGQLVHDYLSLVR